MKELCDQSLPQIGTLPPNEVSRIAQYVRNREGRTGRAGRGKNSSAEEKLGVRKFGKIKLQLTGNSILLNIMFHALLGSFQLELF